MTLLKTRFGIDDFILEMTRISPVHLQLEQLKDWVGRLELTDELFQHHISFCQESYQRQLLCRTSRFDMLILCWQSGQCSTIHNHGDSLNATRVYRGVLTSRKFEMKRPVASATWLQIGQPHPCLVQEDSLSAGELVGVDRYDIHQLANTSNDNLVTLHVYARPLQDITVYCSTSGKAERVPVRYS